MVERHYRRTEIETLTGFSRSAIYDLMSKGEFPRPVRIGKRAVAWPESKIIEWLESREAA
ncbi:MAG: AlpA family transcriptional regulator [Pseudomonadota bacterium]